MNIKEYVKFYDLLSVKECKRITTKLKKNKKWEKHTYYDAVTNSHESFDDDLFICYDNLEEDRKMVMDKLWYSVNSYVRKDLSFMNSWFNSWSGYSPLRWNKYSVGTKMKIHCDHIQTLFDGEHKGVPILTILGALNENYEGGELIFWENERIELKTGQIVIFPSNFMYPHQVNPVTKGARFSFVSWVW